jgi:hypothetical protein
MKIRLHLLFVFLLFAAAAFHGQSTSLTQSAKTADAYETLLAKLTGGDTKIDYTSLRLAYSRSKDANPYGADHDARRLMNEAVIEKRCDEAMKMADALLASIYVSADAHVAKSTCYRAAGDNGKADFHKAIYLGLINSILAKGDGNSTETAYTVITIEEEYAVMKALGYTAWEQTFVRQGEHTFNVVSGTDDRSKSSAKFYFNVDIPLELEKERKVQKP